MLTFCGLLIGSAQAAERETRVQPKAVKEMLDRIGGRGTAKRMLTYLIDSTDAEECFRISQRKGMPCIEGTSLSALTTGVGWYLNHYVHVNLSWNCLTADLSSTIFPLPDSTETHTCRAPHRYYLNYCTFGYSTSVWTWERWQQEIDWMALHGINMPLQLVGLEKVWRDFLMNDLGPHRNFTEEEAEAFVPGPAFTAWWGMNNLEGWGGDDATGTRGVSNDAWYERQARLAKKIVTREKELGIEPVLPGFSGMVPHHFQELTGYKTEEANHWCGFQRPTIMDPTSADFAVLAMRYYARLEAVMGRSKYYSMDPFHEGGTIKSGRYKEGYAAIFKAMDAYAGNTSRWILQQWQWTPYQATSLTAVPAGRLLVLDLNSDAQPRFDRYKGYLPQEAIFCTIPNFGGRTGFFGRLPRMAELFFQYQEKYPSITGIGAAPEGIEQTPVVYDLLYELPWMKTAPDTREWIKDYVVARYGNADEHALKAWELLRQTALNDTTALQGPHEAVVCARPSLHADRVSTWGSTKIFYADRQDDITTAVMELQKAHITSSVGRENFLYDKIDLTRQMLTDDAQDILADTREAWESGDTATFRRESNRFLQLILELDNLLDKHPMFRLERWISMARAVAQEVEGDKEATADWLEFANARTLITTWGPEQPSEAAGLHDYSYREWHGMLKDFYYPRWAYFFSHGCTNPPSWFPFDWEFAHQK